MIERLVEDNIKRKKKPLVKRLEDITMKELAQFH